MAAISNISPDPKKPSQADRESAIEQNRQWAEEDKAKAKKRTIDMYRHSIITRKQYEKEMAEHNKSALFNDRRGER